MKKCLNCEIEYKYKRDASKFCSGRCRVAYNRKNPKQGVTPVQMQVLYNLAISALEEIKNIKPAELPSDYGRVDKIAVLKENGEVEPLRFNAPKIALKSFEQWQAAKMECETAEQWEVIKAGISAATNLTTKQKDLLIKYS